MSMLTSKVPQDQFFKLCLDRASSIVQSYRDQAPAKCDPRNTFVATGVAIGVGASTAAVSAAATAGAAVLSTVGGAIASHNSSQAAKGAAFQNAAAVRNANSMDTILNLSSRGVPFDSSQLTYGLNGGQVFVPNSISGVASSVLPYYFGKGGESGMAKDVLESYKAANRMYGTSDSALENYRRIIAKYAPTANLSDQAIANLFNGGLENTLIDQAQPVWDQNVKGAKSQIQAGFEALAKTLNDIDTIQAKKGFTGDSSGKNMLKFAARESIGREGAAALNQAFRENAIGKQAIQSGIRSTQLANVDMPNHIATNAISRAQMPLNALTIQRQNQQAPLAFFKLGQNQFQPITAPISNAVPNSAQTVSSAIGSLAGNLGSIYQQYRQQQDTNGLLDRYLNNMSVSNFPQPGNSGVALGQSPPVQSVNLN